MNSKTLHIKNMVCNRCIKVVSDELKAIGLEIEHIELGKVQLKTSVDETTLLQIKKQLEINGFELIDDKKSAVIVKIKSLIIELIHQQKEKDKHINISDFLSNELHLDYSYISNLFSSVEGTTIEKYIINQKIEKVKELLVYDELNLNEITFQLGYSSVQHLSSQFKKIKPAMSAGIKANQ
jgi:AraC-like DNA-binding protein